MTDTYIREAAGIFKDSTDLQNAIAEMESSGFERRHISVLGSDTAMQNALGRKNQHVDNIKDNDDTPRSSNIAPQEVGVAQGALVSAGTLVGVAAAVIASGGLLVPGAAVTSIIVSGAVVGGIFAKILEKNMLISFKIN